jgi:hypothetical protein
MYDLFQDGIMIMFIKMEEPKDFVTWLQVAKVIVLAFTVVVVQRKMCGVCE